MAGLYLTGFDALGAIVLEEFVDSTLSEGRSCDRLRQCPALKRVVLRLNADEQPGTGSPYEEAGVLTACVRSPWLIVRALSGLAIHRGAEIVIEIPHPDSPLSRGIVGFWSACLDSEALAGKDVGALQISVISQ